MFRLPELRYAHIGDDAVAWYSFGEGPETIVGSPGFFGSVESIAESPGAIRLVERFSKFRRVVLFDHRSTGLSDTFSEPRDPTVDDWVADVMAVIDVTGHHEVDLFAIGVSSAAAIATAARYPDRVSSLTLICGTPKVLASDDFDPGMTAVAFNDWRRAVEGAIDAPQMAQTVLQSATEVDRTFLRRAGQRSLRPAAARRLLDVLADTDVRDDLANIVCRTLLIHAERDAFIHADCSRFMAAQIPSSELALLPTDDHVVAITMPDAVADLSERFHTGHSAEPSVERRLLAVVCTDIVDSTRRAASMGDAAWRLAIGSFDADSRACIEGNGGTAVKFTGDGHLATFSGPGDALTAGRELCSLGESLDLPLRIGINFGEVEVIEADVLGVSVVVAARVMGYGDAGEIIATSTVVDLVDGAGHRWVSIGEHELKGIERPRALWRLSD